MRIAIISDAHLGDPMSVLAFRDRKSGEIREGEQYTEFKAAIRKKTGGTPLDYLVLLGDILDFSVASYNESYAIGQFFFQKLIDDKITDEIIYVPGNHDFDLWDTVEYQVNVTNRLIKGKLPEPFRMSVPGILDDRESSPNRGFTLHTVKPQSGKTPKYAGLFLDNITSPPTPFNFAYPNLYLVSNNDNNNENKDETILITHGQYLDAYWSIMGKWAHKIIAGDLELKDPSLLDLKEMVAMNIPLSQLACSGAGQAGPLSRVAQKLEHELKDHELERAEKYLNRVGLEIKKRSSGFWGQLKKWAYGIAKKESLKAMSEVETSRYRVEFMEDPKVRERFKDFYSATACEIQEMNRQRGMNLPLPTTMIFGHTHQPIPWNSPHSPSIQLPQLNGEKLFYMYNTGGWLNKKGADGKPEFCGAEIFFYETGKGMSSVNIAYKPEHS